MKRLFLFIATLLAMSTFAQTNMELAQQAYDTDDYASVIQYTTEQLKVNPKDVKALALRAAAFLYEDDQVSALTDVNAAIKYWNKKCEIALGNLYCLRGIIYESEEQYDAALKDYATAIKKDNKNPYCYKSRANLYYQLGMYDKAEADYRKAYELNNTNTDYAISLARCLSDQDKNEEAAQILDKIVKYEPKNIEALRLRAVMYFHERDFISAIDYYTAYLSLEPQGDLGILLYSAREEYAYALKVISNKIKNPQNEDLHFYWLGVRVRVYQLKNQYQDAINDLQTMQAMLADTVTNTFVLYHSAVCHYELYEYADAAKCYTKLIAASTDYFPSKLYLARGACYDNMGKYDLAISDYSKVIDEDLNYAPKAYCNRGVTKEVLKDYDGALEDYNKGLLLDDTNLAIHMFRGRLLLFHKQDSILANIDFKYILEHDTTLQNSIRHYALLYSGKPAAAEEWMNKVLENDPSYGNYYEAACLYSRMNRLDEAMRYLKTSLDMGYRNIVHLETDSDLDPLRNRQDYKDLIEKYRKQKIQSIFNKLP